MSAQNEGLMVSISHSIHKKEDLYDKSFIRYFVRSIYASLLLGIGLAVSVYMAGKAEAISPGSGKFFYALMFSWGLIMIIYLNAELGTSNMMYMTNAAHRKILPAKKAFTILGVCILGNALGALIVTFLLSQTTPFSHIDPDSYLVTSTITKLTKTPMVQLIEGVFANVIVNVAIFCSIKMKDDAGKILGVWFIVFIFSFLGYEHVIANFSLFSLAFFSNHGPVEGMTVLSVLQNFLFSGMGNYIGGGLVIGLVYSWLNHKTDVYLD